MSATARKLFFVLGLTIIGAALQSGGAGAQQGGDGAKRAFPETYKPPATLRRLTAEERTCVTTFVEDFPEVLAAAEPASAFVELDVNPPQELCAGAKKPHALIDCFRREYAQNGDWRWSALGCRTAGQAPAPRAFPDTGRCIGDLRNCDKITSYVPIYPELEPLERECQNLILTSGVADASKARLTKRHAIYSLCQGTVNPYSTMRCFFAEYARFAAPAMAGAGDDAAIGLAIDRAAERCSADTRAALGDKIPVINTDDIKTCQATAENLIQAFLSNVTVLGTGCDGATVCGAVADADDATLLGWMQAGGASGFAQNFDGDDPKGFLWEALGCAAAVGLDRAQVAAGASRRVKLGDLCSFLPDQLAKTITAAIACGNVHVRDGGDAAACAAGETRGHEVFDRLKRLIFVPGKPECLICPEGFAPALNKFDHFASELECYSPCPAGTGENYFSPSFCRDGAKRETRPAMIATKGACPEGQFAASLLFTEDAFCMSGCQGLALGETCFGVKTNPDAAQAALRGLKPQ
ncbi:MAG: hypothetical protein ACK5MQ_04080 [Pikeienuella sp.]